MPQGLLVPGQSPDHPGAAAVGEWPGDRGGGYVQGSPSSRRRPGALSWPSLKPGNHPRWTQGPNSSPCGAPRTEVGATWSPSSFIVDDGTQVDGLNLGAVAVDRANGSVFLFYALCIHQPQPCISSTMLIRSRDDGLSWSRPRNLSQEIGLDRPVIC
ncbi:unnamed protein product [Natator depressus]